MIYIVAGQYRQAEDFARRLGLYRHTFAFINEPQRLYGVRAGSLVVFTDTATRNPHYLDILQECAARDLQTVMVDADRLP